MGNKYWHTKLGFKNPKGSSVPHVFSNVGSLRWFLGLFLNRPYKLGVDLPDSHILSTDEATSLFSKYKNGPSITWLGHASFLFQIGGKRILTDPFLSGTAGPVVSRMLKRLPQPLPFSKINDVDVLLISHQHSDHLHHPSLQALNIANIIVPPRLGKKVQKYAHGKTREVDWFEGAKIGGITITVVPAQHYSNMFSSTLWAGFLISFRDDSNIERKIYFSGDTGYGPFIKRDISPLGPFDIACIGAGACYLEYSSRINTVHTNPEEAVKIAQEIKAARVIGMHWGTVRMADENPKEIISRMEVHTEKIGYGGEVVHMRIGETIPI